MCIAYCSSAQTHNESGPTVSLSFLSPCMCVSFQTSLRFMQAFISKLEATDKIGKTVQTAGIALHL